MQPRAVEREFDRMQRAFSGAAIVQQAEIAVRAVESIGGASKLTASEQQRLNGIVSEAIAKYNALGQVAPQELRDIEAATKKVETATKDVASPMSQVLGLAKQLGPALGLTFSVGTVTAFAKSIGDFAGKMIDLQTQTKISTDRLQALNYVGAGAGLTLEDITGAADQLAKRVGDGDKSAVGALQRLNIESHELSRLSLDEALLLIDDRLKGVTNQFQRADIQADLFGKTGMRMGRILDGELRNMVAQAENSGAVIDKELIKRADQFDDAWSQAWIRFKAGAVNAIGAVVLGLEQIDKLLPKGPTGEQRFEAAAAAIAAKGALPPLPGPPGLPTLPPLGGLPLGPTPQEVQLIEKQAVALGKAAAAQLAWNEARTREREAIAEATAGYTFMLAKLVEIPKVFSQNASLAFQLTDVPAMQLPESMLKGLMTLPAKIQSQGISKDIGKALTPPADFFSGLSEGFKHLLDGLTNKQGAGGFLGKMGTGIAEGFGNLISGGLTSLIGGGISLLGKGIGKLFGGLFGGGEGSKVNDLRDAAFSAAGGFDALNEKAALAGVNLDRVLSAKRIKEWEAAWKDLQGTLNEYEADQERLNEAIQKYGFSIEELGPKMQAQELNKQAKELIEDWRVLVAAGIDITVVNEKMASTINDYLQTALKVGAEVPAAMKPILEAMAQQGTLVDENGEKITDLEKAGVKFSESMTEGFDRVVKKLDELIKQLQGAGRAIESLPDIDIEQRVHQVTDAVDAVDSMMERGFSRRLSQPSLFLAGEARASDLGGGRDFSDRSGVAEMLAGLDRRIGSAVSRAVSDALTLAPGWR